MAIKYWDCLYIVQSNFLSILWVHFNWKKLIFVFEVGKRIKLNKYNFFYYLLSDRIDFFVLWTHSDYQRSTWLFRDLFVYSVMQSRLYIIIIIYNLGCNQKGAVEKLTHFEAINYWTNVMFWILKTPNRPYLCLAKVIICFKRRVVH